MWSQVHGNMKLHHTAETEGMKNEGTGICFLPNETIVPLNVHDALNMGICNKFSLNESRCSFTQ